MGTTTTWKRVLPLLLLWALPVAAGDLEPQALPAPTQATLIYASDLPLTITTPGSYRLAENITGASGGITITGWDVNLDLAGFCLCGGTGDGIVVTPGWGDSITIHDGTVAGWTGSGINVNGSGMRIERVRAAYNGVHGISAGEAAIIVASTAHENVQTGIRSGNGSLVKGSSATYNGSYGIDVTDFAVVTDSTAAYNVKTGIRTGVAGTVRGCAASHNDTDGISVLNASLVVDSTANYNGSDGIVAFLGATIEGNVAVYNVENGILIRDGGIVRNNLCSTNGYNGDGAGIFVRLSGSDVRVEDNNTTGNDRGIDVDGTGNVIVTNTSSGNGASADYTIGSNNVVGQIVIGPGGVISNSNVWTNWRF